MAVKLLCEELLPNAIGLTDAFGFSDYQLNRYALSLSSMIIALPRLTIGFSALGVHDGNAYEALWNCTQNERLNNKVAVPAEYEVRRRSTSLPQSVPHYLPIALHQTYS